ncbi:hypothetical protein R0J90_17500, partial [Micrococcus sp. SIMBA_144]
MKCDQRGKLKGELDIDQKEFVMEETREYVEELNLLLASGYNFDKQRVEAVGRVLIPARSLSGEKNNVYE